MKVAILGYADQGQSSFEYWSKDGNEVTVCDQNDHIQLPSGTLSQLGPDYLKNLDRFDLLVRTPSLHPRKIVAANSAEILNKITSSTNEFFNVCPSKNVIGVTGTKGKGTTSTLIAKMLEAAGKKVHLGGNIGTPPLVLLKNNIQTTDWVVLELANFQLIDLKKSPHIGVCVTVYPEHLDWHEDVGEYLTAKQQMFKYQSSDDIAIYFAGNIDSQRIVSISKGYKIPYMQEPGAEVKAGQITIEGQNIININDVKLIGRHNWQNICAAVTTAWQVTKDLPAMHRVINTFGGLEHRLEFVREFNGVKYYDDSFGTTPETAIVAIEAFDDPKVIILGGSDKGAQFDELGRAVSLKNVRGAVTIGAMGSKIAEALRQAGFSNIFEGGQTMKEIVAKARSLAQPGDIVLLSTACASFDMFTNYKDRGDQFKNVVNALA